MKRPSPFNDNSRNPLPRLRETWDIYRATACAQWLGQVVAGDANEAMLRHDSGRSLTLAVLSALAPPFAEAATLSSERHHLSHAVEAVRNFARSVGLQ
jgi:hypothetical protein